MDIVPRAREESRIRLAVPQTHLMLARLCCSALSLFSNNKGKTKEKRRKEKEKAVKEQDSKEKEIVPDKGSLNVRWEI